MVCGKDKRERLDDETLALSYLYLCDEFGKGELLDVPNRNRWARGPLTLRETLIECG